MAKGEKFVTGLVAGTLIGAAIGLLIAPKPGKETRKMVGEKADDWKHRAEDYIGVLREKFRKADALDRAEEHSDNGVQYHG